MQELISQIAALGIEITPTRSLMIIFGIILFTAVVVHLILHKVVLRAFEKRALASSHLWLQIITQNKLFHRLAFTLQGIIVNVQAVLWLQKRQRGRGNINHRGPAVGDDICHAVLLLAAGCHFKTGAEISRRLTVAAEGHIPELSW